MLRIRGEHAAQPSAWRAAHAAFRGRQVHPAEAPGIFSTSSRGHDRRRQATPRGQIEAPDLLDDRRSAALATAHHTRLVVTEGASTTWSASAMRKVVNAMREVRWTENPAASCATRTTSPRRHGAPHAAELPENQRHMARGGRVRRDPGPGHHEGHPEIVGEFTSQFTAMRPRCSTGSLMAVIVGRAASRSIARRAAFPRRTEDDQRIAARAAREHSRRGGAHDRRPSGEILQVQNRMVNVKILPTRSRQAGSSRKRPYVPVSGVVAQGRLLNHRDQDHRGKAKTECAVPAGWATNQAPEFAFPLWSLWSLWLCGLCVQIRRFETAEAPETENAASLLRFHAGAHDSTRSRIAGTGRGTAIA